MTTQSPYALIVDDDTGLVLSLRHLFSVICGLECVILQSCEEALDHLQDGWAPRVIILGRPSDLSVTEGIRALLKVSESFLLVLDRKGKPQEAEEAFLAGAHDVVAVPFRLRELALRLRSRVGLLDTPEGFDILSDSKGWDNAAYISGQAHLTSAEAQIAHILMSHRGQIVSRDALSYAIDHRPWDYGDRKFDVHVAKIRKKLDAVFGEHISVKTVRAAGYILNVDETGIAQLKREIDVTST